MSLADSTPLEGLIWQGAPEKPEQTPPKTSGKRRLGTLLPGGDWHNPFDYLPVTPPGGLGILAADILAPGQNPPPKIPMTLAPSMLKPQPAINPDEYIIKSEMYNIKINNPLEDDYKEVKHKKYFHNPDHKPRTRGTSYHDF